jgi:dTMP kinase
MMKKNKGKLIVIDGSDGSGKTTQWDLLKKRFKKENAPYYNVDFPIYKSFFGKFIKKYLYGEFGDPKKLDPYYSSFPYALDRFFYKDKIIRALSAGKIVLTNRYVTSNLIYQGAKLKNEKKKEEYLKWINKFEYEVLELPKPDLMIYLYVPVEISKNLLKGRADSDKDRKIDGHENSYDYQNEIVKNSKYLCGKYKYWKMVNCVEKGELLSKKDIHERVWQTVKNS